MTTTDKLLPCPFCGAALRYAEPVVYVHPIGKCILSGRNFGKGYIGQWNRRASQAAPAPSDALREALAALEAKASAVSSAHARKGGIGFAVAEMGPAIIAARDVLFASPAQEGEPRHD